MENRRLAEILFLVTQVGLSMLAPIALCAALGIFLGKKTGNDWLILPLLLLGSLSGFRNTYRLLKKHLPKDGEKERTVPAGKKDTSEAEKEFEAWKKRSRERDTEEPDHGN